MQIVIDIDDEQVFFDIKNRGLEAETETDKVILNALYNGTPLPKGHGRMIDADELYNSLKFPAQQFASEFKRMLDDAHTIIEADWSEEG